MVLRVIAGVVVGFATVPAKPFAETTETVVTVPAVAGGDDIQLVPSEVSKFPEVPAVLGYVAVVGTNAVPFDRKIVPVPVVTLFAPVSPLAPY